MGDRAVGRDVHYAACHSPECPCYSAGERAANERLREEALRRIEDEAHQRRPMMGEPLQPRSIRARMARNAISPNQLRTWWSPDTDSDVDPMADPETQADLRRFLSWLWGACLAAEGPSTEGANDG